MILKPEHKDALEQLGKTTFGHALKEVLQIEKEKLTNIKEINSYDELLGKKYALEVIEDLFSFMEEKKTTSNSKNQYT